MKRLQVMEAETAGSSEQTDVAVFSPCHLAIAFQSGACRKESLYRLLVGNRIDNRQPEMQIA